jgi:hypothetical protein
MRADATPAAGTTLDNPGLWNWPGACRGRLGAAGGLIVLLLGAGCGERAASTAREPGLGRHVQAVAQDDYGDEWPFGPNRGVLRCRRDGPERIVTFEVDGVAYALSRAARRRGLESIRSILLTDHAGLPYDYSPVLGDGLALCAPR